MAQSIQSLVLLGLFWLGANLFAGQTPQTRPMPLADFEIRYEKAPVDLRSRIKLDSIPLDAATRLQLEKLAKVNSPQGLSWYRINAADFLHPGPWTTRLYFKDCSNSAQALRLVVSDHGNGGVLCSWINEKLVFVQAWWGRIRSTDMILNIETGRFLYLEDANYYGTTLPPELMAKPMSGRPTR